MSKIDSWAIPQERVVALDSLRGFALFGILLINSMSILAVVGSTPMFTINIPWPDRLLQDLILFFVESKFFTLFSLLFGIGFAIQIQSANKQGQKFLPRISRRLLALLIFGLLHIALFWDGDILVIYAIAGTLLIFFRNLSDAAIRRWVIGLLAVPGALTLIAFMFTVVGRTDANLAPALQSSDLEIMKSFADTSAITNLVSTNFVGGIGIRINSYLDLSPLLLSRIPTVLAMFLIGLYVGRTQFYRNIQENVSVLRKLRNYGLGIGLSLMALVLLSTKFLPTTSALVSLIEDQYVVGPILCLGIAASFALLFVKRPDSKGFRFFASAGKMALSNYISQSIVLTFISYGWGLGLGGTLTGYLVLGIAVGLYFLQVVLSTYWLKVFEFGPLEWLWRIATYARMFPIKIRAVRK